MKELAIDALRYIVLIASIADSYKYKFLSNKISRLKSSREVSRKFINISIFYRVFLLLYSYLILEDWMMIWSCFIALYTLAEAFYYVYLYYPYKNRKKKGFKRPSLKTYAWNSLLPNRIRKRL